MWPFLLIHVSPNEIRGDEALQGEMSVKQSLSVYFVPLSSSGQMCVHVIQPFESRLYTSPGYWNKSWEQTQSLHVKPQLQGSAAVEPEQRLWWFLDSSREKQRHRRGQQEPNEITVLYTWLLTVQKWLFWLSLWFSLVCFIKWYNCMVW